MKVWKLAAVIFATLLVAPVAVATARPAVYQFAWASEAGNPSRATIVEQYSPYGSVTNTTSFHNPDRCAWDIDDQSTAVAHGDLAASTSTSWTECQVIEGYTGEFAYCTDGFGCGRPLYAEASSTKNNIELTVCFSPGRCWTPPVRYNAVGRYYYSWICVRGIYPYGDPLVQEIPGSGGGYGVITDQTVTVRNTTNKPVKAAAGVVYQIGIAQSKPNCPYYETGPAEFDDGLWRWNDS